MSSKAQTDHSRREQINPIGKHPPLIDLHDRSVYNEAMNIRICRDKS